MSNKKATGGYEAIVETYTIHSGVDGEEQKKKVLGVFKGSFFRSSVGGGHSFF